MIKFFDMSKTDSEKSRKLSSYELISYFCSPFQLPEVSEMMANWFGGGPTQDRQKKKPAKPIRR